MAEAAAAGGRPRVLITGASGTIGRVLREGLQATHEVLGLDARRGPGADVVADARKLRRIRRHFEGIDVVIDLAAAASSRTQWKVVWKNNIPATVNTLEAARLASVRRVVFASSNHVTGLYERDEPFRSILAGEHEGLDPERTPRLTAGVPIRPDGPYALGKALGEAAARLYAEQYGLSVICLRIGNVNPQDRPQSERQFAVRLSHRDLVELVRCCIAAPPALRFGIYYGVSANTWRIWDRERARDELGYVAQDDAEHWRLASRTEADAL